MPSFSFCCIFSIFLLQFLGSVGWVTEGHPSHGMAVWPSGNVVGHISKITLVSSLVNTVMVDHSQVYHLRV